MLLKDGFRQPLRPNAATSVRAARRHCELCAESIRRLLGKIVEDNVVLENGQLGFVSMFVYWSYARKTAVWHLQDKNRGRQCGTWG